jgi:hypothetical protein
MYRATETQDQDIRTTKKPRLKEHTLPASTDEAGTNIASHDTTLTLPPVDADVDADVDVDADA